MTPNAASDRGGGSYDTMAYGAKIFFGAFGARGGIGRYRQVKGGFLGQI